MVLSSSIASDFVLAYAHFRLPLGSVISATQGFARRESLRL
jgi:hypothetical protein